MAHNLCYTTLLDRDTINRLELKLDVDYIQTPNKGTPSDLTWSIVLTPTRLFCQEFKTQGTIAHHSGRLVGCT
jgi:hypothetical protein